MSECFRRGDLGAGHLLLHTFLDPFLGLEAKSGTAFPGVRAVAFLTRKT